MWEKRRESQFLSPCQCLQKKEKSSSPFISLIVWDICIPSGISLLTRIYYRIHSGLAGSVLKLIRREIEKKEKKNEER